MTAHPQWPHTLNDAIEAEIGSQRQSDPKIVCQHAVNTAAALFPRLDWRRRSSGRPFVCDDLL